MFGFYMMRTGVLTIFCQVGMKISSAGCRAERLNGAELETATQALGHVALASHLFIHLSHSNFACESILE